MTDRIDRIDHAAEAQRLVNHPFPAPPTYLTEAQIHATLALVEQQRIANLFMLHAMVPVGNLTEKAREELDKAFPMHVGNREEELGL